MNISNRIVELRKNMGINTSKLAKIAGVSQSYLSDIEHNNKKCTIDTLEKICNALNITLSDFFDIDKEIDLNMNAFVNDLYKLDKRQLDAVKTMVNTFLKK